MAQLFSQSQSDTEVEETVPSIHVMSYLNPQSFLQAAGPWLRAEEMAANTILPYAEMLANSGHGNPNTVLGQTHWIVCWSLTSPQRSPLEEQAINKPPSTYLAPRLCFVLMAAESHMGPLPLFLFSPSMLENTVSNDPPVHEAMRAAASKLVELRPPQQTSSIFGPAPLLQAFATIWDSYSVYPRRPAPLRRLKMLACSLRRFNSHSNASASVSGNARVAMASDILTLADLIQLSSPVSPSGLLIFSNTS